jgi:hypothetical protein
MVKSALSVTERGRRGDGCPWMDGVVMVAVKGTRLARIEVEWMTENMVSNVEFGRQELELGLTVCERLCCGKKKRKRKREVGEVHEAIIRCISHRNTLPWQHRRLHLLQRGRCGCKRRLGDSPAWKLPILARVSPTAHLDGKSCINGRGSGGYDLLLRGRIEGSP